MPAQGGWRQPDVRRRVHPEHRTRPCHPPCRRWGEALTPSTRSGPRAIVLGSPPPTSPVCRLAAAPRFTGKRAALLLPDREQAACVLVKVDGLDRTGV